MAEEPLVVRGINWRETFGFTHIFRAFRIAIHPSKLVLALLAMLCLYFGGRILDGLWVDKYKAVPDEIFYYDDPGRAELPMGGAAGMGREHINATAREFDDWRAERRQDAINTYAKGLLHFHNQNKAELKDIDSEQKAQAAAEEGKFARDVNWEIGRERDQAVESASKAYQTALENHDKAIKDIDARPKTTDADRQRAQADRDQADKELKAADAARNAAIRDVYANAATQFKAMRAVEGQGLFDAFLHYQSVQVAHVAQGVLGNNWLGGMARGAEVREPGVVISTFKFFTVAPSWALRHHPLYFLIYGILFLCVWSLFGGAIARIAAVHVADEGRKLSVRQGLSFAFSKFLSFISAPMIPLIIVGGIGLVLAVVGGILMLIPYVGQVLVGVLFFLALGAGFVMTLVLLGMAGGFNLMYPTIAVEGSDSFDAISRSFSYVYAKPWRMLWYSVVAIAYGSICFLFVRLFLWLMLCLTQFFVGWFVFHHAANTMELWPTMFPRPEFWSFAYEPDTQALDWGGKVGAWFIAIWVYLAISLLAAFAISFYFSASTIIYYLMRREVDATEMDDVYLDQPEEDFAEAGPAAPTAPVVPTTAEVTPQATVPQETPTAPSAPTIPSTGGEATAEAPPSNPLGDKPAGG